MILSDILHLLSNVGFVGFVVQIVLCICSFFRDPEHEKNKFFLFHEKAGVEIIALWGLVYYVLIFACIFIGVDPAPSFPSFEKVAAKFQEMDSRQYVTAGKNKIIVGNNLKKDYENNTSIVIDTEPETENTMENNKTKSVIDNNKTRNTTKNSITEGNDGSVENSTTNKNKIQNSKSKNSNNDSMADKIKYAKQHNYTFLYNNEKVNMEDFDYENSDVVVLNNLKLVIGMPK